MGDLMSLKQNIVIKNQFTVKTKFGGSRGKSPGNYVRQYMLREGAVEDLTPTKLNDFDAYSDRLIRKDKIINSNRNLYKIRSMIDKNDKLSGIAFGKSGNGSMIDLSMTNTKVNSFCKKIQKAFDDDKTVFKTVLSFDEVYLKEMGVLPEDFHLKHVGDYKGNLDQLKLRSAVCEGLEKMGKNFSNLNYIGCLQVDTAHVHAHLCMFDEGVGRLNKKGEQIGKLNEKDKRSLRRGIDMGLGFSKEIAFLSSNYNYTKNNSKSYVKKYTHRVMKESGLSQLLIAVLPEDQNMWRANSNRKEMKGANNLVNFYVRELLAQKDSGYDDAIKSINKYAYERYERENLSDKEYKNLIKNGKKKLIDECVNGVYQVIKDVNPKDKVVRTKTIDHFATDYNVLANMKDDNLKERDPMIDFSYKLRTYSSRLNYHKDKKNKNYENQKIFEDAAKDGDVSSDSYAMLSFYKMEREYNEKLMAKYQHFLKFLPIKDDYKEDLYSLAESRENLSNYEEMLNDSSFNRFKNLDNAEKYGKDVYGLSGGRHMVLDKSFAKRRYRRMEDNYKRKKEDFKEKLRDDALNLEENDDKFSITDKEYYDFDDVKALDLHHLEYDFYEDVPISKFNIDNFVEMSDKRYDAYKKACDYLTNTGQKDEIKNLDGEDIILMNEYSKKFKEDNTLTSLKSGKGEIKKTRTVALNEYLDKDIENMVKSTVLRVSEIDDKDFKEIL